MSTLLRADSKLAAALSATLHAKFKTLFNIAGAEKKKTKYLDLEKLVQSPKYRDRFIFIGDRHSTGPCFGAYGVDNGDEQIGEGDLVIELNYSCQERKIPQKKRGKKNKGPAATEPVMGFAKLFVDKRMKCDESSTKATVKQQNELLDQLTKLPGPGPHFWSGALAGADEGAKAFAAWEKVCTVHDEETASSE